jgi:hypothetical protein
LGPQVAYLLQLYTMQQIGSVDRDCLQRARRMAQRSRSATACMFCKVRKAKCSDYRPCARCTKNGGNKFCLDAQPVPQNMSLDIIRASSSCSTNKRGYDDLMMTSSEQYIPIDFSLRPFPPATHDNDTNFSPFPTCWTAANPGSVNIWIDTISLARGRSSGPNISGDEPTQPDEV